MLEQMLAHQDPAGRFQSCAPARAAEAPLWGALLCDSHALVEVLVRYGHDREPKVAAGLARMTDDLTETAQGRAWPCLPEPVTGFRGPGRKGSLDEGTLAALHRHLAQAMPTA